ncbi:MAG: hypothetical protein EON58_08895 [Alphaproteobacteria bacterium]|nr:MAG: hypothetical protein EON58_08895 [Alphaproteobacteria bacterium]
MNISDREKRELIAGELADIFHRQEAIIQCNELLNAKSEGQLEEPFRTMVEEDRKLLRLLESVLNGYGLRVEARDGAAQLADFILEQLQDETALPLEQLNN